MAAASSAADASAGQRVAPAKPWEPGEVRVGAVQRAPVLDREGGQVRVGGEVAGGAEAAEEAEEVLGVPVARMHDHNVRLGEPGVDVADGLVDENGSSKMARLVVMRTNARSVTQASPTGSSPESTPSHQSRAARWWGAAVSYA
jgi:hypothetical protein